MSRLIKSLAVAAAFGITSQAFGVVLVSDNFDTKTLGALVPQSAQVSVAGTNWDGGGPATVVNTGPVLGTQSVSSTTASLGAGLESHHSWVDLYVGPATNFAVPTGFYVNGSVDVLVDAADTTSIGGLGGWANGGGNLNGFIGIGNSSIYYRSGVGIAPTTTIIAPISSISGLSVNVGGWNKVLLQVEQVDATTITSRYFVNGTLIPFTHTRIIAAGNGISDFDLMNVNGGTVAGGVTVRYDNFLVETVAIPEPTTLAVLAGAGVLVLRRRRA